MQIPIDLELLRRAYTIPEACAITGIGTPRSAQGVLSRENSAAGRS